MKTRNTTPDKDFLNTPATSEGQLNKQNEKPVAELNGPKGPEPTRFGDWERKGRCVDF